MSMIRRFSLFSAGSAPLFNKTGSAHTVARPTGLLNLCAVSATRTKSSLTHVDESGDAHMVDVSGKAPTLRSAIARGQVRMSHATLELIKQDGIKKGNVLSVAQVAGIMGAKSCSQIIPLCHPINISKVSVKLDLAENAYEGPLCCSVNIEAQVKCKGETGVEMEALSAVSIAALTVFDMCKAVSKNMRIEGIRVVEKTGGKSGNWKIE